MTTTYTLTTSPLVTQGSQLRWHIDSSSSKEPLTLTHGRIVLQGWLLAQGETSPRLAIKTGTATYSFAFNAKRPDVVAAILQQPADNHPKYPFRNVDHLSGKEGNSASFVRSD